MNARDFESIRAAKKAIRAEVLAALRLLTPDEREKYNLYYAKNQSLILDIEILIKSLTNRRS